MRRPSPIVSSSSATTKVSTIPQAYRVSQYHRDRRSLSLTPTTTESLHTTATAGVSHSRQFPTESLNTTATAKVSTIAHPYGVSQYNRDRKSLPLSPIPYGVSQYHRDRKSPHYRQSLRSLPIPPRPQESPPSPKPTESPNTTATARVPTIAKSLRSLPTSSATAKVYTIPQAYGVPTYHRDRRSLSLTPTLRSLRHHPRQSRGCAVVSLAHVYKPLVGLYTCARASIEKGLTTWNTMQ